MLEETTHLL